MSPPAIQLQRLKKSFGPAEVLQGVNLTVEPGTIQGYIGPNGAGKTTTVRILCGLIPDFEGDVRVAGLDPRRDPQAVKARVGFVPENGALYESLTVSEYLTFVGRLHGLEDDVLRHRAEAYLEAFGLGARLPTRIDTLSKGMRQRLLLVSAFLHEPEVLFLDEPLNGLDANTVLLLKDVLRRLADQGRTIFYCSHVMDVVERLCDRIAVLHKGSVVAEGTFEDLARQRGAESLEAVFSLLTGGADVSARVDKLFARLASDA